MRTTPRINSVATKTLSCRLARGVTAFAITSVSFLALGGSPASGATTAPAGITFPKFGESGENVKQIQTALMSKGFTLVGGTDGVFSPRTRATLRSFQKVVGLKATGRMNRQTAKVLGLLVQPASVASAAPVAAASLTVATLPAIGAKGELVTALQNALIAAGIKLNGGADGIFGKGTKAAIASFQKLKLIATTGTLDESTAIELGLLPRPVLATTIAVFPVQGKCSFGDTWQEGRSGGRLHEGVDVIANRGNLLYAVADGTITRIYSTANSPLSGNGVRITTADGTYFFYAHLDTIAADITLGSKVIAGQVIGTVGSTGNTTTSHLHFEVHPQGGAAVNPYPIVKAVDACSVMAPAA